MISIRAGRQQGVPQPPPIEGQPFSSPEVISMGIRIVVTPDKIPGENPFLTGFMKQLDHVVKTEDEAKLAYVAAVATGANVVFVGPPGGAKTNIMKYGPRVISGVDARTDVAIIPAQPDLTGKELVGSRFVIDKETRKIGDELVHEKSITDVEAIIKEGVKVINGDEINRTNQQALNAILELLESGEAYTNHGLVSYDDLLYSVFAANHRVGNDRTIQPLTAALLSRLYIGASMGANIDGERDAEEDEVLGHVYNKSLANPDAIKPVVSIEDIMRIRQSASQRVVSEGLRPSFSNIIRKGRDLTTDAIGSDLAIGRFAKQSVDIATTLSLLVGRNFVSEADLLQAMKFGMVARIGASESHQDPHEVFEALRDDPKLMINDTDKQQWHISETHKTR